MWANTLLPLLWACISKHFVVVARHLPVISRQVNIAAGGAFSTQDQSSLHFTASPTRKFNGFYGN